MKITSRTDVVARYAELNRGMKKDVAVSSATQGDAINISPAARMLKETLHMQEPFDAARVSAIKAAISKGEYTVDSARLADRLISELRQVVIR